jgi:hypothetical protein
MFSKSSRLFVVLALAVILAMLLGSCAPKEPAKLVITQQKNRN